MIHFCITPLPCECDCWRQDTVQIVNCKIRRIAPLSVIIISVIIIVLTSSSSAFDVMTVLNPQAGGC